MKSEVETLRDRVESVESWYAVRIERLADGEGLGARAWDVLSAFVGGAA